MDVPASSVASSEFPLGTARPPTGAKPPRLASVDAYRGVVMLLIMSEVLQTETIAHACPDSGLWRFVAVQSEHVEWTGCTLHDLIQPSFSFLVGVALTFSIAGRRARGESMGRSWLHALWRSILLILLGVFLRSTGHTQTFWTFEDTVTQIGLGYPILFLLSLRPPRVQWIALTIILVGYWAAWAVYPIAAPNFDWAAVGVPPHWEHLASGFAAHWNKNANLGNAFDQWFLNLFPREHPFLANDGGYLTLSFIPTLGTMSLGLIAGGWLRDDRTAAQRLRRFALAGAAGLALGWALGALGICPVVKRIWTPSWTLFSGGWCFLLLAAFYGVIDAAGWKRWAFPLRVVGLNSIAAYIIIWLMPGPVSHRLELHFGAAPFAVLGDLYAPFVRGVTVIGVYWLILFWMYRQKIFLKI